jgi:hypothetical protein
MNPRLFFCSQFLLGEKSFHGLSTRKHPFLIISSIQKILDVGVIFPVLFIELNFSFINKNSRGRVNT